MKNQIVKWIIAGIVIVVLGLATAYVQRDVYSKDEVDAKVKTVETVHKLDYNHLKEQTTRIEANVDKLVDHLIEEDS